MNMTMATRTGSAITPNTRCQPSYLADGAVQKRRLARYRYFLKQPHP